MSLIFFFVHLVTVTDVIDVELQVQHMDGVAFFIYDIKCSDI